MILPGQITRHTLDCQPLVDSQGREEDMSLIDIHSSWKSKVPTPMPIHAQEITGKVIKGLLTIIVPNIVLGAGGHWGEVGPLDSYGLGQMNSPSTAGLPSHMARSNTGLICL